MQSLGDLIYGRSILFALAINASCLHYDWHNGEGLEFFEAWIAYLLSFIFHKEILVTNPAVILRRAMSARRIEEASASHLFVSIKNVVGRAELPKRDNQINQCYHVVSIYELLNAESGEHCSYEKKRDSKMFFEFRVYFHTSLLGIRHFHPSFYRPLHPAFFGSPSENFEVILQSVIEFN